MEVERNGIDLKVTEFMLFALSRPFQPWLVVPQRIGEGVLLGLCQGAATSFGDQLRELVRFACRV